ncbi:activator-dependent family glycosyltransferase [Nonomuraea sp. NN258]|uniref:activator-dependent family glycosyltransferase n=1 Tax=Nonomuraea antri TaxID=2730852 RepID=UPI00156A2E94|nr:activator-dependent family glycosyltransferase [Nonomuraea antri]NRQ31670.1 activator-dependent family glycosyltransferase [Nonomuraea antri]
MKVLLATYAERAHFLGMVPLAWALQNAGHEVRVASQPELTDVITATGLTAVPVGKNHILHQLSKRPEAWGEKPPPAFDFAELRPEKLTWEYLGNGYGEQFVPWWCRVVNDPMIRELTEFALSWRPDLVVWEAVTYAGPIAAKACGAAHVRVLWSLDLFARLRAAYLDLVRERPGERHDALAGWIEARGARFGVRFSEDMAAGQATVDCMPASIRLAGTGQRYLPMRYRPYNGRAVVQDWMWTPPERPRVCLTLGTSATERLTGYSVSVQELLDALADLDVELVATIPEKEQAGLREVPDNARIVPFVPLNALLPSCSAVVNHGGAGTFLTSLVHGVPQLVVPYMFDDGLRAERLAELGAGLVREGALVSAASVRADLVRLLTDDSFGRAAAGLQEEAAAMATPRQLVAELERLVAERG